MNFRNKYLIITVRVLLGLIFLGSGISGLLMGNSTQGVPAALIGVTQAFWQSGIFQMVKVTEIIGGLMLISGFLPWLATILVAPICIGVIVFNARVLPPFVIAGIIISILNGYLGYAYWDKYKTLFKR